MTSIFNAGTWISTVWDAGKAATESTGMMGALQSASSKKTSPGSLASFFASQQNNALTLSSIAQTSVTSVTSVTALAIQMADAALQKRFSERAAEAAKHNVPLIPAEPLGERFMYFGNGSSLDTEQNILTLSTGKKINTLTGADWVDPASIVNFANGSYLDTANSILTMANGTKINTITGLTV